MKLTHKPYLLLTLAVLLWSGNFVVGRAIQGQVPPVALAFWRWMGACLLVVYPALPHLRRDWPRLRGHWGLLLLLSAVGIAAFNTLVYTGLQWTEAINAFLLQSLMPVLIVAMSFLLFRERVSLFQAFGIAISLTGAVTIILRGDWNNLVSVSINRGDVLVLIAVVCYAAYSVLLRKRPAIHPLSFIVITFFLGALMLAPFYIAEMVNGYFIKWSVSAFFALSYVAIFPSIVSYLCYNRGVELLGANQAGLFIHLMPVFGSCLAMLFLGESLNGFHGLGIVLIAGGIFLATSKRFKRAGNA